MKPYKTDIAVALIFFNRPKCLKEVFAEVAAARPSRLYLIQDGARSNRPDDLSNIMACREIVGQVDWDCQVIEDFSEVNLGCGRRIFSGISKVFEKEEYAAIIEDDIKIGESFLPFCKEMCEKYKHDERIQMISGMNHLRIYEDCPYSYFFSQSGGAIWGWATWRRCWQELDWEMKAISNPYIQRCLENSQMPYNRGKLILKKSISIRNGIKKGLNPTFWSMHFGLYRALSSRLNIVPKYNLISNIGITADSTHSVDSIEKMPKRIQVVFFAPIYNMPNKLIHPEYIINDQNYMNQQEKIMNPSKWVQLLELPEKILKKFIK